MRKTVRCTIGYEKDGRLKYEPIPDTYRDEPEPYDPAFGDERMCECGTKVQSGIHTYYRHFDTYDDMRPVGCKYCGCREFKEAS